MINKSLEKLCLWLSSAGLSVESDFIRKLSSDSVEGFSDEGLILGKWGSAASGLLITDGKRVLLLKRSESVMDPGLWAIPGGAIPVNKSGSLMNAETSAFRETAEEIGSVPSGTITGKTTQNEGSFSYTTFYLRVSAEELSSISPVLNWEHTDWMIVDFDKIGDFDIHPGVVRAIIHFRSRAKSSNSAIQAFDLPEYIYHASKTEPKTMVKVFLTKSFTTNRAWFGRGLYGVYDIDDSSKTMSGIYGDYIYKLNINPKNFLVLDKSIIGSNFKNTVLLQLEEKFGKSVYDNKELLNVIEDPEKTPELIWRQIQYNYPAEEEFSGILIEVNKYGKMAIVFDPSSVSIKSFSDRSSIDGAWTAVDLPDSLDPEDDQYIAKQYANYYPELFFKQNFDINFPELTNMAIEALLSKDSKKLFDLDLHKRETVNISDPLIQEAAKKIAEEDPIYFLNNSLGTYFVKLEFLAAKKIKSNYPDLLNGRYQYLAQTYGGFL